MSARDDLTQRLREIADEYALDWRDGDLHTDAHTMREAADEIDARRAEREVDTTAIFKLTGLLKDTTERLIIAERLGRLEFEQSGKWQEIAEDLWEELQLFHSPECPQNRRAATRPCTCHRILAAKWDEITHAADWADDDAEADR